MTCDDMGEKLVELIYEERPEADRAAVDAHLATCAACRAEHDDLRRARSALAAARAAEPAPRAWTPLVDRPRPWRRWLVVPAAAVVVMVVMALVFRPEAERGGGVAYAKSIEIERLDVSLTILSKPSDEPTNEQTQKRFRRGYRYGPWKGLALVRDQRVVRYLKQGVTEVRFTDVPSEILPDTVRLSSLTSPGKLAILEQNYQYDLATAEKVLDRYIDHPITVTFKDGATVDGTLLSFDKNTLVVRPEGGGPQSLSREQVRAVAFAELPEGLLSRPTLVWQLENRGATRQQFEVAYLTRGLKWRADYVLKLRPDQGARRSSDTITDTADLVGYATITNNAGVTFPAAQLKLMAGDVSLFRDKIRAISQVTLFYSLSEAQGIPQFQEKAFFEYHLYTLGRPTTIRNAETKQIELTTASGVGMKRHYSYDARRGIASPRVASVLANSKANRMGMPLPKGVVRLYAPDPSGVQTYVAQASIDHTPVDEKIRFMWGHAFDVVCSGRKVAYRRRGDEHHEAWECTVRNHKDHDVTVTVVVRVPASTYKVACERVWRVAEVGRVEIDVPAPADEEARVTFSYDWNPTRGGGLTSPHDAKKKGADR